MPSKQASLSYLFSRVDLICDICKAVYTHALPQHFSFMSCSAMNRTLDRCVVQLKGSGSWGFSHENQIVFTITIAIVPLYKGSGSWGVFTREPIVFTITIAIVPLKGSGSWGFSHNKIMFTITIAMIVPLKGSWGGFHTRTKLCLHFTIAIVLLKGSGSWRFSHKNQIVFAITIAMVFSLIKVCCVCIKPRITRLKIQL